MDYILIIMDYSKCNCAANKVFIKMNFKIYLKGF